MYLRMYASIGSVETFTQVSDPSLHLVRKVRVIRYIWYRTRAVTDLHAWILAALYS